jgi:hypothetical protein
MRHTPGSATFATTHTPTDFMAEIMPRKYKNVEFGATKNAPLATDGHPSISGSW